MQTKFGIFITILLILPVQNCSIKKEFDENCQNLKIKYSNQTQSFWANVESSFIYSILESKGPSVIMIVNDKTTNDISNKITNDLLDLLLKTTENSLINKNQLIVDSSSFNDADLAKKHIDTKLETIFKAGKKVALIKQIQYLPAVSLFLFHKYGDEFDSEDYKGYIIIITLQLDINISNEERLNILKKPSKLNEVVENYLLETFSPFIHEDQLKPIFTRICNNLIFVNNEDK